MRKNYLIRLCGSLGIALLLTWMAYEVIIASDERYFHVISKNEFVLLDDTTTYDLLLLGSSRMKNHVNPGIVDSLTRLNTFNAGCSGANAVEIKTILESYLYRHAPPRYILMSLDLFSLESEKILQYYPTYITCTKSPPIAEALREEGVPTHLYNLLPFLKVVELNDYYKAIVGKAMLGKTDIEKGDFYYKGFVSNSEQVILNDVREPPVAFGITDRSIAAVDEIIQICKRNDIKLIMSYAPEYKRLNIKSTINANRVFAIYDSMAKANNIPFRHDEYLDLNNRPELFANNGHLNRRGAGVYSVALSQELIALGVCDGTYGPGGQVQ